MVSGTITDASGRTLSGPDRRGVLELGAPRAAARRSGLNCALGAKQLRPYVEELSRIADAYVMRLPERRPAERLRRVRRDACETWRRCSASSPRSGLVNIVGGCCGTTPEHIARDREAVAGLPPRAAAACSSRAAGCAGLEPLNIGPDSLFVNVGERTNVTGSAKFRKLIEADDYDGALDVARQQVDERRADHRRQHGRGHARLGGGDGALPAT